MIELEQGVAEARLSLSRRIVNGIGSVVCASTAFYGALCVTDGAVRAVEPYCSMPPFVAALHTATEYIVPDVLMQWGTQHLEVGWRGIGEMAVGMLANWACRPLAEGLRDEALS